MVRMHICMYTRMYLWSLELEKQEKQEKKRNGKERRGEQRRGEERRGEKRRGEERHARLCEEGRRKEEKRRRRIKGVESENERGWSEKKRPVRVRETDGWERPSKNL